MPGTTLLRHEVSSVGNIQALLQTCCHQAVVP